MEHACAADAVQFQCGPTEDSVSLQNKADPAAQHCADNRQQRLNHTSKMFHSQFLNRLLNSICFCFVLLFYFSK